MRVFKVKRNDVEKTNTKNHHLLLVVGVVIKVVHVVVARFFGDYLSTFSSRAIRPRTSIE